MQMKKCPHCKSEKIVKNGPDRKNVQKYRCKECKKNFLETHGTIYHGRHLTPEKIDQIVEGNCEGLGQRASSRLFKVARGTVKSILEKAGQQIKTVNDEIVQNIPCNELQFDEMWSFIKKTC
jgi:transposase-like protein